jgi:hypothetical protein
MALVETRRQPHDRALFQEKGPDMDWFELLAAASNTEVDSMLRLTQAIKSRHPHIQTEQLLDFATPNELAAMRAIRTRLEQRWVAQQSV